MIRFLIKSVIYSSILTLFSMLLLFHYLMLTTVDHQTKASPLVHEKAVNVLDKDMVVHFLNLEIGKSILIQIKNQGILIDVGHKQDAGTLLEYLNHQKIEKVTDIFLSNGSTENMGGIDEILEQYPQARVNVPALTANDYRWPSNISINKIKTGERLLFSEELAISLEILSPLHSSFNDKYNDSMVCMLYYHNIRTLLTNDIREEAETKLLTAYPSLKAEIMTVPDRPNVVANSSSFIRKVNPQTAVMLELPCVDCKKSVQEAARSYTEEWSDFFFVPVGQNLMIFFDGREYITPKTLLE